MDTQKQLVEKEFANFEERILKVNPNVNFFIYCEVDDPEHSNPKEKKTQASTKCRVAGNRINHIIFLNRLVEIASQIMITNEKATTKEELASAILKNIRHKEAIVQVISNDGYEKVLTSSNGGENGTV